MPAPDLSTYPPGTVFARPSFHIPGLLPLPDDNDADLASGYSANRLCGHLNLCLGPALRIAVSVPACEVVALRAHVAAILSDIDAQITAQVEAPAVLSIHTQQLLGGIAAPGVATLPAVTRNAPAAPQDPDAALAAHYAAQAIVPRLTGAQLRAQEQEDLASIGVEA